MMRPTSSHSIGTVGREIERGITNELSLRTTLIQTRTMTPPSIPSRNQVIGIGGWTKFLSFIQPAR